jgi:hypothetical protein
MWVWMAPSGRTNFFAWAFASAFAAYIAGGSFGEWGAVVVSAALLVFWRTRYRPEALGALAGFAAIALLYGFLQLSVTEQSDPAPRLLVGAVLAVTIGVLWRHAFARADASVAGGPSPQRPPRSPSSSGRLALATVMAAIPLLIISLFVSIGFGFSCQSDTGRATPGSDHAGYCDLLTKHGELLFLVVAGPAFLTLVLGLIGSRRRDGAMVAGAVLLGVLLVIVAHVPDFTLSDSP